MIDHEYAVLHVKAIDASRAHVLGDRDNARPWIGKGTSSNPSARRSQTRSRCCFTTIANGPSARRCSARRRAEGIPFTATIPTILDEPGTLRDRMDEAWQSIKAGIIRGVSVGYRILKDGAALAQGGPVAPEENRNYRALARHDSGQRRGDDPHDQVARRAAPGRAGPSPIRRCGSLARCAR